jgi:KamA family protein
MSGERFHQGTISKIKDILSFLSEDEIKVLEDVIQVHPMLITRYYFSLIDWSDPNDPIRKMIIPSKEELIEDGSYDTSGEKENTILPGLQHKYKETALLLVTNRCASYCRYCFRKRLVGLRTDEILERFNNAVSYIKEHSEITNVLISGGDPMVLPTSIIEHFLKELSNISHLKFIRIGTKIPVFNPKRIYNDQKLLSILRDTTYQKKRVYVVTHFNHPKEITKESIKSIDALTKMGIIISNQTVLLKDVNDSSETLSELMKSLVSIGVVPYYVFQCRPVKRVKNHFQVPLYDGYYIVEKAKSRLDGHSKRFKYVMSHKTGKIEIIGIKENEMIFKYHQAKNPELVGKVFSYPLTKKDTWLPDELKII